MPCIVAFIILSILGIFSASHRKMARDAFGCVLNRVTLRPCDTGLQQQFKGMILGPLLNRSVPAARFVNKYFEILSWVFVVVSLVTVVYVARGAYNFYAYGSCNGLNQSGFCVFDPSGSNNQISAASSSSTTCNFAQHAQTKLTATPLDLASFPQKIAPETKNSLVFIGCYTCDYSRKTWPIIEQIAKDNKLNFTFIHFPVKPGTDYLSLYDYAAWKLDPDKFWELNDKIFASKKEDVINIDYVDKLASQVGYDPVKIRELMASQATKDAVAKQQEQIKATGIYGTPTIFVNSKAFVGPKPKRVYDVALGRWW